MDDVTRWVDAPEAPPIDSVQVLAAAMVQAAAGINQDAVREIVFLELYLGDRGREITRRVIELKIRQNAGVLGRLEKAIGAVSLKELWKQVNLNFGGK